MEEMPQEPIQLKTPMNVRSEAKTIMEQHGCLVEEGCVTLPMGSRRKPCLQILTLTFWYEIILPDQYQILEAYDRRQEISMLYVAPEGGKEEREE